LKRFQKESRSGLLDEVIDDAFIIKYANPGERVRMRTSAGYLWSRAQQEATFNSLRAASQFSHMIQ
jgi:hypothetical protein